MAAAAPSPSTPPLCAHCHGFGYAQAYWAIVLRVYCDCDAGSKRIQAVRKTLEKAGLDPDSPGYQWLRKADIPGY